VSTTARNSASTAPAAAPAPKKAAKKTSAKPTPRPATGPAGKAASGKVPASRGARAAQGSGKAEQPQVMEPAVAVATEPADPAVGTAQAAAGVLPVRPGEDPWAPDEVAEVETDLRAEVDRLRKDVASADSSLADLLRDAGDGAGDDQADAGSKNFEREHEMSIANNARDMLVQSERALARIAAGTYGICESCGEPIGKARLQVFPRATLCMSCKQKQERR
jgi:DnaK suppressor protein